MYGKYTSKSMMIFDLIF